MTEKAKAIWTDYQEGKKKKSFQEQHKRMSELQQQLDLFNSELTLPHIVKYRKAKKIINPDPDEIEEILEEYNKENYSGNKQPYKFEASRRTLKNVKDWSTNKGTKGGSRKGTRRRSRKGSRKRR